MNTIGIFNERYQEVVSPSTKHKALCVFDFWSAKYAFTHFVGLDFLIVIDERKGTFKKCLTIQDAYEFLNPDKK